MKTDIRVSTTDCKNCGKAHTGFSVKLDAMKRQYVICGSGKTAKRVDVTLHDPLKSKNSYFPGKWTIDKRT